jgi:serine phosphatase RsbU (regulator of sigma subunit)
MTVPAVALRSLVGRQKDTAAVLDCLAAMIDGPFSVEDASGRILHGPSLSDAPGRFPVTLNGTPLGWVTGSERAEAVAAVLSHLAAREAERKTLGVEVLHLYREVNLIYAFSEQLASRLELRSVAELTLAQARHLLSATDGGVLLLSDAGERLEPLATYGDAAPQCGAGGSACGLIAAIVHAGHAEIVNDVQADTRRIDEPWASLLCAPLKVGERVTGAIVLASSTPVSYTAADLKLLNTLALQTATALENARLFERTVQAARERERLLALHKELELAARIQADLFPAALPRIAGYDLAARNRPARQCGGDYYDVLPVPGGTGSRMLFCVADVSGKGLPASLLMSSMQATLRALLGRLSSLPALAMHANDLLHATTPPNKYVTAALLELDTASGEGRYVSAGHTDTLHLRATGETMWLGSTGTPLGLMAGLPYGEASFAMGPGDVVALFSDGVTEAQDAAGEEFGEARLADVVRAASDLPAQAIVQRVFEAIDAFAGEAPQYDDITLLVLKR